MTTQEMLDEVERMLEDEKRLTGNRHGRRVEVLKSIAGDLRARVVGVPSVALFEIERRITAVRQYPPGSGAARVNAQVGVAEEIAGRWPVVKQALERFGADVEQGERA